MDKVQKFVQRIRFSPFYYSFFLLICLACTQNENKDILLSYIDPGMEAVFLEEKSQSFPVPIPAIGTPFGMTHWAPEMRETTGDCDVPYIKGANKLLGLRASHWSNQTCSRDYGSISLMVQTERLRHKLQERAATLSTPDQEMSPAYYHSPLTEENISVELTAADRSGFLQFHFTKKDTAFLLINTHNKKGTAQINYYPHSGEVWVRDSLPPIYDSWKGSAALNVYSLIRINKAIAGYGVWEGDLVQPQVVEVKGQGDLSGLYLKFPVDSGEIVQIKAAFSYWDIIAARLNLTTEIPNWDFDLLRKTSEKTWENLLATISLEAPLEQKRRFYQAMYYASISPRIFSGVDGLYPAFAEVAFPYKTESGAFYGDFSNWNSLNDPHPLLLGLLFPERWRDMKVSLESLQEQADTLALFPNKSKTSGQISLANLASQEILGALGLRPDKQDPGLFSIQSPTLSNWTLHAGQNHSFSLEVKNFQEGKTEIEAASLNGKLLDKWEISLSDIHAGGKLEIVFR